METVYKCSQSKGVKWFAALFILILILAIFFLGYHVSHGGNVAVTIIVAAVLLFTVLFLLFLFPVDIIAWDDGIGIRTLLQTIRIPAQTIDHIEWFDDQHRLFINNKKIGKISVGFSLQSGFLSTGTICLFGVRALGVCLGWFRTKGIGSFRSFVTDDKKVFLIHRTSGKPIAISFHDPDAFQAYYKEDPTGK